MLRNSVRQSHRSRVRRLRREERAARPESVAATTGRELEDEELRAQLERHIAGLREPYRTTVVLHYMKGLSLEEIARRQDAPSATVRTRLRRALLELRARMTPRERSAVVGLVLGALRPGDAAAAARTVAMSARAPSVVAHVSSSLCLGGVMQLGIKSITIASVVSLGLVGTVGGLYLIGDSSAGGPAAAPLAVRPTSKSPPNAAGTLAGPTALSEPSQRFSNVAARSGADSRSAERPATPGEPEPTDGAAGSGKQGPVEPASEAILALRRDYSGLRSLFNESSQGWKLVGENIAGLREVLTQSEEGFDEFLALIDGEKDEAFLEAVLHHLPLRSGSPLQKEIVEDEELHAELWARFEDETDPYRQRAFLRFFCYQPRLNSGKLAEFAEIAQHAESPLVRSISLDAISSANFPKETWPALCEVAEHDTDESLRAVAIRGLAMADTDRAREIYRAAFSSEAEPIRSAAVSAHGGEGPPPEAVGGNYTSYLVRELRDASTKEYRQALLDRLLAVEPLTLLHEADRALGRESDRQARQQYRSAVEAARERVEQRG